MANFKEAITQVLGNEGGYVDSVEDLGGVTNYGISLRFLQSINIAATADTIKNLSIEAAEEIYFEHFWLANNYDAIASQAVAEKVFDTAVNMGSRVANRFLQRALNILIFNGIPLKEDGVIGAGTISTVNALYGEDVDGNILKIYSLLQKEHYGKIVINRPHQRVFLGGWFKRADR